VLVRKTKAFPVSIGLSVLFLIVYGGCIWITSQRSHVGSIYFEWERNIPFVPFFIIPYLSIDLFFIAAPFLCGSQRELKIFSKRVGTAILVAGLCFLVFPLRFAFARPSASGWLGVLFDWFRSVDAPYNLLPSLHAALCLLLADLYARKLRGVSRIAMMIWFALIALSPLLTSQHHFIDIAGGFSLAGYCFYLFPEPPEALPVVPNPRIGVYYLAGTIVALVFAVGFWPSGALFLWPATSLAIIAAAYSGVGPIVFRKADGRLPRSTRFVLGPCLLGQYLSLLYYRRRCQSWNEITDRVWMGGRLRDHEARAVVKAGVTAVLDLTAEFSETKSFRGIVYRNIPVLDLTAPTRDQLKDMGEFISQQSRHGVVYVHCKIGYSRSAAAVAAYLIMSGQVAGVEESFAILRTKRPSLVIRPEIVSALLELEHERRRDAVPFLLVSAQTVPS
jgi:protein-tyrosine phosphatase/membrane-associated phospholipid phosphatase